MPDQIAGRARLRFSARNYVLLAAAVISLVVGYWLLSRGSTGAAPILLVLGYCVLFPLGLALSPPAAGTGE
jgi:uncharacterized membrane protein HdeD (DUF308 family)